MLNAAHSLFKVFQSRCTAPGAAATRENHRRCPSIPWSVAVAGRGARMGCAHEHL